MTVNFDNLAALKPITRREAARWTVWEITGEKVSEDGVVKKTKIIRKPDGSPVPKDYPITENTGEFADVIEVCRKNPKFVPGFWFIEGDGLVVMDVDAPAPLPDYPTYTERSISPGGYHMLGWFKGACPNLTSDGIKETFRGPHWIVLTGDVVDGKNTINDMTDFFAAKTGITYREKGEPYKFEEGKVFTAGEREPEIFRMAGSMKGKGFPVEAAIAAIQAVNKTRFNPSHPDDYVKQRILSAYKRKDSKEWTEELVRRKEEDELNKLVDHSELIASMKKLDDEIPLFLDGIKLGSVINHIPTPTTTEEKKLEVPEHLLKIPGILQDVVEYYNATSIKDQTQFAITTALAVGAMVLQRRVKTDNENYASINIVDVGETSTGKERLKGVVEELGIKSGLSKLIGPSGYTSSGGVFTALMKQPAHLCVIDELGRLIGSNKKMQNGNSDRAITSLMEIFGRLNGIFRPEGYSKLAKKNEDPEDLYIHHPAISLFAMTTPDTLYENLSSALIKDGFLPRLLVVETELGRVRSKKIKNVEPSDRLLSWMKKWADIEFEVKDQEGKIVTKMVSYINPPEAKEIPFDPSCNSILENYEIELEEKMEKNVTGNMSEMYGKTREIAMRISLIVACSCESPVIMPEHLNWAKDFTNYYTDKLINRLGYSLSDSDLEAVCNDILKLIEKSGTFGITDREIVQRSRKAKKYSYQARNKIIMPTLMKDYGIQLCPIGSTKRIAWVSEKIAVDNA